VPRSPHGHVGSQEYARGAHTADRQCAATTAVDTVARATNRGAAEAIGAAVSVVRAVRARATATYAPMPECRQQAAGAAAALPRAVAVAVGLASSRHGRCATATQALLHAAPQPGTNERVAPFSLIRCLVVGSSAHTLRNPPVAAIDRSSNSSRGVAVSLLHADRARRRTASERVPQEGRRRVREPHRAPSTASYRAAVLSRASFDRFHTASSNRYRAAETRRERRRR